jgi:hypothetical protein
VSDTGKETSTQRDKGSTTQAPADDGGDDDGGNEE